MDEGKNLLISIIEDETSKLLSLDTQELYIEGINIKNLFDSIVQDINSFYQVTDDVIMQVIKEATEKNQDELRLNVRSARDLLIGKKEYNLNVRLTQEHIDAINIFKKCLDKKIRLIDKDIVYKEENLSRISELKKQVLNNYLIKDLEIVESIVRNHDKVNFDKNMLVIMKYINDLNINLIKTKKKNAPIFDIQMIRRPKMDPIVKEILKKLDIKPKEIPNFLLSELKKCDPNTFESTYKIIKRNKAEMGGILHFIEKDNIIFRLVILLYATPESILGVVESIKDDNEVVNIPLLKLLVNKLPSAFIVKNNTYYKPKFNDFITNMKTLKNINVNYGTLIKRNPLFMTIDAAILEYTLDFFSKLGADKKDIVNRCYKTLSVNPSLLIENVEIMQKFNIDLIAFFSSNNTNYNLLKMSNLEYKLKVIKAMCNIDLSDFDSLNKVLITKIYNESKTGYINWGDIK